MTRLGAEQALLDDDRRWVRPFRRFLGIEDLHTPLRFSAVQPYLDLDASRTLEVGAGTGVFTFYLARNAPTMQITATELEPASVAGLRQIAARGDFANVEVLQRDLRTLNASDQFDQVLAIDVLEHIDDDVLAMTQIADALRPGGRLVISVPTPHYPTVFGREWHESIGHVRDGYWFKDLDDKLALAGLTSVLHKYYTGRWANRVYAALYPNLGSHAARGLSVVSQPFVRVPLRLADRRVREEDASSLAVLAVKARR